MDGVYNLFQITLHDSQTYYEDDDYKLSLEELDGQLFVHLALYHASKSILRSVLERWCEIKAKCYWLGYEAIYTYTTDDRMKLFFPYCTEISEYDYRGKKYKVLKWELK